jgi:hypothetical protein
VLEKLSPSSKGLPAFPFIGQGKDLGYMRERGRRKERENRGEDSLGATSSFFSGGRVLLVV